MGFSKYVRQGLSKHVLSDNYRPTSETPSRWRFAGGPIVVRDMMLVGGKVVNDCLYRLAYNANGIYGSHMILHIH